MGDEVVRTAIQVVGSYDVIASLHNILKRVSDGSSTRCDSQSCHTAFEGCYAVFENSLCRVGQTTVDITCIAQAEAVGGMLRVVENVARGLIDGYCAGIGCGVGLFLTYM